MFNDAMILDRLLTELSVRSIEESIDFVTRSDLKTVSIEDLKAALYEMLRAFGSFAMSIKLGAPLFRAMKHNPDEEFFKNVKRIYPDPVFLKKLGRANRDHQAVFYLSGNHVIAFHEIKAKPGDMISLLECRPRNGVSPIVVPIGIDELMKKHGIKAGGGFPEASLRIRELLKHEEKNLLKYKMIDEFLTCQRIRIKGSLPNLGLSLDPKVAVMATGIDADGRIQWPP